MTSSCPHFSSLHALTPPRLSQSVHREECTLCFDNQDNQKGIDVCLVCFNGGCVDGDAHPAKNHARIHVGRTGHTWTMNVERRVKADVRMRDADSGEPPTKIKKLAIQEERDEDKYDLHTSIKCWACDPQNGKEVPEAASDAKAQSLTTATLASLSSARQSEVKAWEEEFEACLHTITLLQDAAPPGGYAIAASDAHCSQCDLKENLWLCLTCGSLGCGRQQFGGVGGNGHGLRHFEETGHGVCVKLGTITPEGAADIYCYTCNDARLDPNLAEHLKTFGIEVQKMTKTERSMTELQIEQNLKYDFSLTSEDGKALEPVFGPGLTGLCNLGNSCYMASVLQTLFALPTFQTRYNTSLGLAHAITCPIELPADCLECQMHKVADGLLSGRYSHPANHSGQNPPAQTLLHSSPTPVFQAGVRPAGFKSLIGKGHEEFSTMRQQDSEEFLGWLITQLRRDMKKYAERAQDDPTRVFSYSMEQRLQCNDCKKVRYRTDGMDVVSVAVPANEKAKDADGKVIYEEVDLVACLEALLGTEALEYGCPSCGKGVHALKQTKFASFPEVLVVHAKKFQLVNWVPAKLDIPINLPPHDELEFTEKHLGQGLQPGEEELPNDAPSTPALPQFNEGAMAQLEAMGFPAIRCQKALLATGNTADAEVAMGWLFEHMEDPDIDAPIQPAASAGVGAAEPSADQISMIGDMGFTSSQARKALRETGCDLERAVEWLFSHPDDTGEEASATGSSDNAPNSAITAAVGGSKDVPVKYRLKAFISHKGPSVHSGHYVAHIRTSDQGWVLFNDEKVVKADEESVRELKRLAYLYVFERL